MKNLRNNLVVCGLALALTAATASQALSQETGPITIKDGDMSFTLREYGAFAQPYGPCSFKADLMVGGVDHLRSLPFYIGRGSFRGQHTLFRLKKREVEPKKLTLTYEHKIGRLRPDFTFSVEIVVTIKIKDESILNGLVASSKLDAKVEAVCTNGRFDIGLPFRLFVMNDPTLGGSFNGMSARAFGADNAGQAILSPFVNGTLSAMTWEAIPLGTIFSSWEINTLAALGGKLDGAETVFGLANGISPFGPGAYAGAFGYDKMINHNVKLSTDLKLTTTVLKLAAQVP